MPERRNLTSGGARTREDRGIFKAGTVEVRLELTALHRKTQRGDILFVGFLDGTEIEVIFPGRRSAVTAPLIADISRRVSQVQKAASYAKKPPLNVTEIRYPLRAEGTWRARLLDDDDGLDRKYQFLVAWWSIPGPNETERHFGDLPADGDEGL